VTAPELYDYQAYLIRLWREAGSNGWRVSLEDPHTGEKRYFASVEQMARFLEEQTRQEIDN
jgi:hypothetical protein